MSSSTALIRLSEWPRLQLANLPTPIRPLPRLAEALGGPTLDLLVKLDSETGFALGGNKVRKLEFELAPDRLEGVTCLITAGGPQSNHCRVTAAAAAQLGLRCVLIVNGSEPETPTGNALLHRLFGAEIVTVPE
ncbi:MAG TPA: pyridoxal-phosphate dependent enzyme, partial [Gemmatimonadetes bacterium]|nr:pyridoxal-phosphate dependent enzyme [Gemmatimonadota bacterium]